MKTSPFKTSQPISVLSIFSNVRTAGNSRSIHKDAAMWLAKDLLWKPTRPLSHVERQLTKTTTFMRTSWQHTITWLPILWRLMLLTASSAKQKLKSSPSSDQTGCKSSKTLEALCEKPHECNMICNQSRSKAIPIEGLDHSIRYSVYTYSVADQNTTLHSLAYYETSLLNLLENTGVPTSSTLDEIAGRSSSSKSSHFPSDIIPVTTTMEGEHTSSPSLSLGK